jgi:hypothetical protein
MRGSPRVAFGVVLGEAVAMNAMTPKAPAAVEVDGPGKTYFADPTIDAIMEAMLEIAAETWTTRDRLYALERALAEKGLDVAALIEHRPFTDEERAERAAMRAALVERITFAFRRRAA